MDLDALEEEEEEVFCLERKEAYEEKRLLEEFNVVSQRRKNPFGKTSWYRNS